MAGTGAIRSSPRNELKLLANHQGPHQRPFVLVHMSGSIGAVRLVGEVSRGHAVVQGLLITAKACIDARLALACEVLGVVGNVGVGICAWRASGLKPLSQALRPGQGDWAVGIVAIRPIAQAHADLIRGHAHLAQPVLLGGGQGDAHRPCNVYTFVYG
jgi:hypothetical protein